MNNNILLILCLLYFVYNVAPKSFFLINKTFTLFFKEQFLRFISFIKFVCENNPLLLHYYDENDEIINNENENNNINVEKQNKITPIYENKYLEKFKSFPSDYVLNETELEKEKDLLKAKYETYKSDSIRRLIYELNDIKTLCDKLGNGNETPENKKLLLEFNNYTIETFEDDCDYEEFVNSIHYDEMYQDVINKKNALEEELKELMFKNVTEEEFRLEARNKVINEKLNGFINNYVLEHTPLGNIYMRYNNDKKSFEYFSNNTIPYRYLEPVGRKYVMTYWCKPLFVDAEEELKQAEIRYEEEKKRKEEEEKKRQEEIKKNPKNVLARMKNYNKDTKNIATMKSQMRNRSVLPPQIKANLVNVNQHTEKQLLKEHANRYTWEGRLTNFSPLQKIDTKKPLTLSYSDYKRMQKDLKK